MRSSAISIERGEMPMIGHRLPQAVGEVQRGLAAKLHDDAEQILVLLLADVEHVFEGERLEVELVTGVVVRGDGLGVGVDHDGLEPSSRSAKAACTQQ